ncbi:MAG: glycosyltransferase family 2 protein [Ensifer adhaerens]
MAGDPKLAIIISCFNYEQYVERAIRSVVAQCRDDCELIVVDDGSTDSSWDVISSSGVTAFRINNSGARLACLFGLDRTRAPFILFLDADDELKPGSLAAIIARLDPSVAKLQFPLTRVNADGDVIGKARPSLEEFRTRNDLANRILQTGVYTTPPTSGNVFRRDVCEILREAAYDQFVDGVILFAAPFMGDVVSLSDELGLYRIHERNDSGLGRALDPVTLERDICRFVARMDHLRMIVGRFGQKDALVKPQDTFFYMERSFYRDIASGRRPDRVTLPLLISRLWGDYRHLMTKVAMTAFFLLVMVLPNSRSQPLLAYRFRVGRRSTLGFLKTMIRGNGDRSSDTPEA